MTGTETLRRRKRLELLCAASVASMISLAVPSAAFAQAAEPGAAGATPASPPGTRDGVAEAPPLTASEATVEADSGQTSTTTPSQEPETATDASEIIVTGSRVVRDGFKAPTPTSVVGTELIANKAPTNIADFLNELPSLSASTTPRGQTGAVSGGQTGVNALNLRGIGANRTLILLDGQRVAASSLTGLVDINTIPQALIERIDIVTGGASANWGSDAVAGVVNFVLDKDFKGLKGQIQTGITDYGDNGNYLVTVTGGTDFADGRGHVILSGEVAGNDGVRNRDWYDYRKIFNNPAYNATTNNTVPELLVSPNAGFATATPGGIITSGPLRGTYFGPGGMPAQFNYGTLVSGNVMVGGDFRLADFGLSGDLDPSIDRQSVFGRLSYRVTDGINLFAQGSYVRATSSGNNLAQFNFGNIVIRPDNAFIPASIAPRVTANFNLGTFNTDLGAITSDNERTAWRAVVGAEGKFEALGSQWSWDVYGQRGVNKIYTALQVSITSRFNQAIDAVRGPNGTIVCRSTLTNPGDGCVPYNVFGTGVNGPAVRDYILGTSFGRTRLQQDVVAGTLRGDPFSTWAGPVSIATGVEHRREKASGSNDELRTAALNAGSPPPYFAGNFLASRGSYNVTEGFLEAVVPLAKDAPFADSLEFNGAVRATNYSTSGYVTTWKAGLTYSPVEDVTFRFTRSRDIRAPNLAELFQAGLVTTTSLPDPFRNNVASTIFQVTSGNQALDPEKADSLGVGVVMQPRFLPGFSASVDYYDIEINDAITTVNGAAVVDQCQQGNEAFCSQITRATTGTQINGLFPITSVAVLPVNVASQVARGVDFEASYRRPLFGGTGLIRFLGTRFLKNRVSDNITPAIDNVGQNGTNGSLRNPLPKFRYLVTAIYDRDPASFSLTARGFSDGVLNTTYVECTTTCPVSTAANRTVNDNGVDGAIYFDANVTAKVNANFEAYLAIDNIANRDPESVAFGPAFGAAPLSVNPILYDVLGRTFRVGVRFRM